MGTTNYSAPWKGTTDNFNSPIVPFTDSGSTLSAGRTDNRSAVSKTKRGKWRPPTNYNRLIIEGQTLKPRVSLRVDYVSVTDPQKLPRACVYSGPVSGSAPSGYALTLPTFPPDLAIRTEQRAFRKLKQQKVNLAVAFGERAATAEHLALTAERILGGLRAARRLDVRYMAKQLRMNPQILENRCRRILSRKYNTVDGKVHSLWLEAQYGWKPMLSDVYGATSELIDRDERFKDRYTVCCSAKDEQLVTSYSEPALTTGFASLQVDKCRMTTRTRFRCYCRFDWALENPLLASLSDLGITNPVEVAWELVPFSFVADWFVPIGTYLSGLDVGKGWSFKGGSMSRLTRSSRRFYVGQPRLNSTSALQQVGKNYSPVNSQKLVNLQRSVYVTPPQSWLPEIHPLSALGPGSRMANAIALLGSFFRK